MPSFLAKKQAKRCEKTDKVGFVCDFGIYRFVLLKQGGKKTNSREIKVKSSTL